MFGKMGDMHKMIQKMQKLMKDENFRAFMAHPKVKEALQDPELKEYMQSQNFAGLVAHPKFKTSMQDPEVAALLSKIDFENIMSE